MTSLGKSKWKFNGAWKSMKWNKKISSRNMKTKNYLDFVVHCFSEMKWTVEWLKRAQDYSSVLFGMAAFPLPLFFGDSMQGQSLA